jgi:multiple sugar transport system substrate-binding protein
MGEVARANCFLPLDEYLTSVRLDELKHDSVGPSFASYCFEDHVWALPIDAAAQVAGYRADLLQSNGFAVPETWEGVLDLAKFRRGFVSVALFPLDALICFICFFTICANLGEEPFATGDRVVSNDIGGRARGARRIAPCLPGG